MRTSRHPRCASGSVRNDLLLAVYLAGSALLAAVLFPYAVVSDLRLSFGSHVSVTGRITAVTGTRRFRWCALPAALVSRPPDVTRRGPPSGSPIRLHRYDFEYRPANGHPRHDFSFAGGGRYAPGDAVSIRYLADKPRVSRATGTTRAPRPSRAIVLVFPLVGLVAIAIGLYRRVQTF